MHQVELETGKVFAIEEGESLLDAASRSNIHLPYSCLTGRCSTCKARVTNGETYALIEETGLTEAEKAEGWVLSCVRSVRSDIRIDIEDLGGTPIPQVKTLPCRIAGLEKLAPDVLKITLRLPPTAEFEFLPGQYISLIGPDGIKRAYSVAGISPEKKILELHVRQVQSGQMSDYLFKRAQSNDLMRLRGPLGTFFLRNFTGANLIFLATGTGIAPVKSMLEFISNLPLGQGPQSVRVIWGGRYEHDLYFDIESSIRRDFEYIPVLSRPKKEWTGARGYVQEVLLEFGYSLADKVVYACGSEAMINDAKDALVQAGLPANQFFSDAFVSSSTPNPGVVL